MTDSHTSRNDVVTQEMLDFLHGLCALDGVWFGDDHPKYRGRFWWRVLLPQTVPSESRSTIIEEVAKEIESAPLTYAGPDPQGIRDMRTLIVWAIRDMKGEPQE